MRPLARHVVAATALLLTHAGVTHAQAATGEIRGRLTEASTSRAIPGGTITMRRTSDTLLVKAGTARPDGSFTIDGLAPGRYTVRFRALGFAPIVRNNVLISAEQRVADLGTVTFAAAVTQLEGQKVVAERDEVTLSPDRNSYSVKNMTTTSGGTAVDVLRNTPPSKSTAPTR